MLQVPCWQEGDARCPVLRIMTDLLLEFAKQLPQVSDQTVCSSPHVVAAACSGATRAGR